MSLQTSRVPRVLPTFEGAPLQPKLQARLGIVEQLQTAGGSMTRRQLFNLRRDRKNRGRWVTAMLQLLAHGIVEQTGTGRRGDPITVRLIKPLPSSDVLPRMAASLPNTNNDSK